MGSQQLLDPLPVGLVWGIGPVTRQRLADRGIYTIGQLAASPDGALRSLLGNALGNKVGALAANDDRRRVQPTSRAGSVGAQSAFGRRDAEPDLIRPVLGHLADRVAGRLRAKHRAGRTVTVRVRFAGMRAVTRLLTEPAMVKSCDEERETLKTLLGSRVTAFNHAAKAKGLQYPRYEGGFFVTVFCDDAHDRALRMKEKGVFVVPAKGALRVALCSVAESDVPRLVDALGEK